MGGEAVFKGGEEGEKDGWVERGFAPPKQRG